MKKRLRVGMVGLGLASSSHMKGYLSHPKAEIAAVCDLDRRRAEQVAAHHGIPHAYDSYDEMLGNRDIDAVDIATPTFLHSEMTVKAASAGKHVHCEKPFCRSVREGLDACRSMAHASRFLAVGETYVFLTSHMKARELIEAGEIGRPLQIRQRHGAWLERESARVYTGPPGRNWRIDAEKSGGGPYPWIFDHAVHFFAAAEYLMLDAKIAQVMAVSARQKAAKKASGARHDPYMTAEVDIPVIVWKFDDPACQGVWMRAERLNGKYDYMKGFSTTVVGERGMIEVLGEGGDNLYWNGKRQHLILHREGKEPACFRFDEGADDVWESEISYYSRGHINQVHHFIECVLSGSPPRYSGEDGVHAVRCTLAAIRSAELSVPVKIEEIEEGFTAF